MNIVRPTWRWSLFLAPILAAGCWLAFGWTEAVGSAVGVLVADLLIASSAGLAWLLSPQAPSKAIIAVTIGFELIKLPILLALMWFVGKLGLPPLGAFLLGFALVYFRLVQVAIRSAKQGQTSR